MHCCHKACTITNNFIHKNNCVIFFDFADTDWSSEKVVWYFYFHELTTLHFICQISLNFHFIYIFSDVCITFYDSCIYFHHFPISFIETIEKLLDSNTMYSAVLYLKMSCRNTTNQESICTCILFCIDNKVYTSITDICVS